MRQLAIAILLMSLMSCSTSDGVRSDDGKKSAGEKSWKTKKDFKRDEKTIIKKIKWLETHPYAGNWNKEFRYTLRWAVGVPYVGVEIKSVYFQDFARETARKDNKISSQISVMYMLGNLLYLLKHPKIKSGNNRAIRRGIISMVRIYNSIRKRNKRFRLKSMEKYKKLLKRKRLLKYIGKTKKSARKKR